MKTNTPHNIPPIMHDTPFDSLMSKRIYNVLLIATPYDAFMLEDDGHIDEEIFNEYASLNLRYPPRFTRVTTQAEAEIVMSDRHFELIIIMPNLADITSLNIAKHLKTQHPNTPIIILTPFSKEVKQRLAEADLKDIDYVFSWLGNSELLLAIVKLIEDKMNAPHDVNEVGVQAIILVEDSVRFYSSALPLLYHTILEQSKAFANEALNEHLKMLRMRGRPKVLLARNYEEAEQLCQLYKKNLLGVITDISFTRQNKKDKLAGVSLAKALQQSDSNLPIILQSSDSNNHAYANNLKLPFVQKHAKTYASDLHHAIINNFGFGDFVITEADTNHILFKIKNLKDLQQHLNDIPNELLYLHLKHNHISRFLYSRAIFPIAEVLRQHNVEQYKDMNEAKAYISQLINQYRIMKHAGIIAAFHKDSYDNYNNFTRIGGKGSLGGKGRGLAFMNTFIKQYALLHDTPSTITVDIPKTVVISTDVFDAFMNANNLYPIALSNASDADIFDAFQKATLPSQVLDDIATLLTSVQFPLAIRSSSLLEDSHFQPFAGVYATYMIPFDNDRHNMLTNIRSAIKGVYASVFFEGSKNYLNATQNLIDQEKMGIVVQEVVGCTHHNLYYPTLSGVARSHNFYPTENEHADDGVVSIAYGLGKHIVEGGKSLRFSPLRSKSPLHTASIASALSSTQDTFWALNLQQTDKVVQLNDSCNLKQIRLASALEDDYALPYVFSTYDWQNNRIVPGYHPQLGRSIITFQNLLNDSSLPFTQVVYKLLQLGKEQMKRDVEIEFAMQLTPNHTAQFFLLQIRPIASSNSTSTQYAHLFGGKKLIKSNKVLGNGTINTIQHIIYVKNDHYDAAQSNEIAKMIAQANTKLIKAKVDYLLIGAGRWGSSDPSLGIPIRWSDIAQVGAIVECEMSRRHIDASQGSHFFQNLTSLGIPYFTLSANDKLCFFDKEWFETTSAIFENEHMRIIHLPQPLTITIDGKSQTGFIGIE